MSEGLSYSREVSGWAGKRVLVTGAGGFIGSHLAGALVEAGAEVRAFLRYTSHASIGALAYENVADMEVVYGDLRDSAAVDAAVQDCEVVFHLGALIGIPYSYAAPRATVETNVGGTLNVLLSAMRHSPRMTICLSTSEVYGTPERVPITLEDPLQAQSPYAATKIGADMLARSFFTSFDLPVALARPFNAFGPRQSMRAVVPTILRQALSGDVLRLGSLHPVRDLTFVADTVAGLMALGAWEAAPGRVVQFGTGYGVTVGELVRMAGEIVGRELEVELDEQRVRPEPSEVQRLICDTTVAEAELGWRAQVSLEEGLRRTAEWIESDPSRTRTDIYAV